MASCDFRGLMMPSKRSFWRRSSSKCLSAYLGLARQIWTRLPDSLCRHGLFHGWARHLHRLVRVHSNRRQYFATFFLRNRPELELLRRIVDEKPVNAALNVCILACSKGAEVYSVAWAIRSIRPDLHLSIHAVDVSREILDFAQRGVYSLSPSDAVAGSDTEAAKDNVNRNTVRDQNASMFARLSQEELDSMFTVDRELAVIRPDLQRGIHWICGDAGDVHLQAVLGLQDVVFANRFMCHMQPAAAKSCLRNVARLVRPGGFLFVSGIDLHVRAGVAREVGWTPVMERIREIHDGDESIRRGWPFEYWGLEPFDESRPDWPIRYASVFQIGAPVPAREEETAAARADL